MSLQRLFLANQAKRVIAVIYGVNLGQIYKPHVRRFEWSSPEPRDIFVAHSSEWYGPRDWSPRKVKRGDKVLAEIGKEERVDIVVDTPLEQRVWTFDPFFLERMLVIIPVPEYKRAQV